ncbi:MULTISPECIES: hypothetical protein [Nostoc]|uniref:Uncharacterized protein n=1 Tax=Nostoc paludosum FACHB-159 TaxID=2692908 RepID=A0ABR8KKR3_9NOSO|nr:MULTISPECIES: hypothetical protein [Nostoc]MBD2682293.1 hypothetical protein [Nostoc sp. FACHB-857]MBD2738627.1 hypothetical protein [Nostoc paludosum FACHB-159]
MDAGADCFCDSEVLLRSPLALPLAKRGEAQASADRIFSTIVALLIMSTTQVTLLIQT